MRQRALVLTLEAEAEERQARDKNLFKMMMLSAHPGSAEEIEEMFSDDYVAPLTDEELAAAGPLGVDEVEEALSDLRKLGFSLG